MSVLDRFNKLTKRDVYYELNNRIYDDPAVKAMRDTLGRGSNWTEEQRAEYRTLVEATKARVLSPDEAKLYEEQSLMRDITWKYQERMELWLKSCTLEQAKALLGGHNASGNWTKKDLLDYRHWFQDLSSSLIMMGDDWTIDDGLYLSSVMDGAEPTHWIKMGERSKGCYVCGKDIVLETNGREMRCAEDHYCEFPEGMKAFDTYLDVPSGVLLFANDFRGAFPLPGKDFYVNVTAEIKRCTEAYGEIGMAHGFCGNTCPGVYKMDEDGTRFHIGGRRGERVGSICTDLWWYSVCDRDEYLRRIEMTGKDESEWNKHGDIDVVPCKPGRYKVTHHGHYIDRDKGHPVYCALEWISDECAPPPVDVETTMYVCTELGHHGWSIKSEGYGELRGAMWQLAVAYDEEGALITREVYPNADRAARLLGPTSVEIIGLMMGGQYLLAPEGEDIMALQKRHDDNYQHRQGELQKHLAEISPEEKTKRDKSNADYYGKDGHANQDRLRRWFGRMVWRAQNGFSVYDGGTLGLTFGRDFQAKTEAKLRANEVRTREKYGAPTSQEAEPPEEWMREHIEEKRLPRIE